MGKSKEMFQEQKMLDETQKSLSKESVFSFIEENVNQAINGEKDGLDVFIFIKELEKTLFEAKKQIEDLAIKEADEYKTDTYKGYKITLSEGRKMYSFKNIPEISEKEKQIKELEEKYKHALIGVEKGTVQLSDGKWVDSDGELLPLPTFSFSKPFLKIEKAKS